MTQLYFVRHAETEMNLQPHIVCGRSNYTKLTPRGERQAAAFGDWLVDAPFHPDVMYVSPALRTQETARLIIERAGYHEIPLFIDGRLQELSQGAQEGIHRELAYTEDVRRQIKEKLFDFKFEDGESIHDVMDRMYTVVQHIHDQHTGSTVMIVSHGFAIRSLVGHLEAHTHDDMVLGMRIPNVSMTHISVTDSNMTVNTLGEDVANVELIT